MKSWILSFLMLTGSIGMSAQLRVTGNVITAEDGEPAIGATVKVAENPAQGTVTDIDGNYIISCAPGQHLEFSYVGCMTEKRKVNASGTIDIKLGSNTTLDEVVVIGYGSVKKSDLTGSVTSVEADKLKKTPSASLANALQGQAAGVTVTELTPEAAEEFRQAALPCYDEFADVLTQDLIDAFTK